MKHLAYFFVLCFTIFGATRATAQTQVAVDQLNNAISQTELIKQATRACRQASNQLAKQLNGTTLPIPTGFANTVANNQNAVVDGIDNIYYHVGQALAASNNGFSPTRIYTSLQLSTDQVDVVNALKDQIVAAIQAQNKALAQQLVLQFNAALSRQTSLANQTATRLKQALDLVRPYRVCVKTVDNNGNPVTTNDLFGFYCLNANNQLVEAANQEGDCWDLPAGTYTFGAYPGYFSGASSETITLSRSMENANGVIVVNLVVWSE